MPTRSVIAVRLLRRLFEQHLPETDDVERRRYLFGVVQLM